MKKTLHISSFISIFTLLFVISANNVSADLIVAQPADIVTGLFTHTHVLVGIAVLFFVGIVFMTMRKLRMKK